ncbi:MAG: T9SS type A sorting domain-containing protein [Calditrichaeota bacterium]|nr:T9SS type A sorting domain-containing protein [Calditrichota bacterium]
MRIFREKDTVPVKIDTVFGKESYSFYNPEKGFVYRFQVKEFPAVVTSQMCPNGVLETAWSAEETIPYIKYPPIQDVQAQALPAAPPINAHPAGGQVYLTWQDKPGQPRVTPAISILLFRDGEQIASLVPGTTDFLDTNLTVQKSYAYNVVTIDRFGQKSSSDTVHVAVDPYWTFTPQVKPNTVTYFRDSVTVEWGWLNAAFKWTKETYGADSCQVGVSIDPAFGHHFSSSGWQAANAGAAKIVRPYFVTLNNNKIYLRVRAKDRWGHVSPWSNAYFGLDSAKAYYDGVPPRKVAHLAIDSTVASKNVTDSVDVYLSWDASSDNISGVKGYYVRRTDSLVAVVPASSDNRIHFTDKKVPVDHILDQYWQVFPFDAVGNIQNESDTVFVEIQLYAPIPRPSSFRSFCWDEIKTPFGTTEYWAEIADSNAYFDSKLAEMLHLISQSGWTTSTCYVDSLFQSADGTAFFRLKVRVGTIESGWSPIVRYPTNGWEIARNSRGREAFFRKYRLPKVFKLYQNYPNPFNMTTNITYDLPKEGQVQVEIWNILGMKVATIEDKMQKAGSYTISWNGKNTQGQDVGTGVYFYTIRVSNSGQILFQNTSKLLLLK